MKILAIANAHALAHVSRLLEIAKVLRSRGHAVTFAGTGKYLPVAARDGFTTCELPYISIERIVEAVRSQRLWTLYPESELERFIDAELAVFDSISPDLVLLDNRPSARTSADIAGIRTAAVLNVHMSNYRSIPFMSYRQLAPRLPAMAMADRLENAIERNVYDRLVMSGLNRIRAKRGLQRRFAYEHEGGDISLLADIPEFNPACELPPHARYVGPLTWRNSLPAPACVDKLDAGRRTVYLSLGSEGLDELVPKLGALTTKGAQVVMATGAEDAVSSDEMPDGVFVEKYVNAELLLPHCDAVCCHGGNGTLYQALRHGLPCVVVATHAEQHYGGKRVQELGLGVSLTLRSVRRNGMASVLAAVQKVLNDPAYRERACDFGRSVATWDGAAMRAADLLEQAPD